mgnify:CR=1 FL=1
MGKSIHIEVSDEQFEELSTFKEERGYTWKGLLLEGHRALESENPRPRKE